jgi:glycosyltransferase involved in cell wall biosynthesis
VTLSIVIPVYNEEPGLALLLSRVTGLLTSLEQGGTPAEVILVDDHSADRSPELLKEACARDPRLRFLRLSRNSGSHVAILAGFEHARGRCGVFLAADLQDPPELIPKMLNLWQQGNSIVWAVRESREGISWRQKALAQTFYWLLNRLGQVELPPTGSDFALLDRRAIDALLQAVGANPSLGGEIARLGFRQAQIPYTKEARKFGQSKWDLRRKLKGFSDAFVSFSYAPMRGMSYVGMFSSLIGFLYAFYILGMRVFVGHTIPGFASLMVAVLVIGGIQMTMLGVLGEYLWRTLDEARRRPRYFIEDSTDARPSPDDES